MRTLKPLTVFLSLILSACNGMKATSFESNQESSGTPLDGRPTAASSGWQHTGVMLTPSSSIAIFNDGVTVDKMDVNGGIIINANNVIIRRSRVHSTTSYFPIIVLGGTNILIEDVEVDGGGFAAKGVRVDGGSVTIRRLDLHDCEVGIHISGQGPVVVEDSYIHSPHNTATGNANGLEIEKAANLTVQGNNLDYFGANSSASRIDNFSGSVTGVNFEGNWLSGGAYNFDLDGSLSAQTIGNITVKNNRWRRGSAQSGEVLARGALSSICWQGNVFDDNGQAINYSGPAQVTCP